MILSDATASLRRLLHPLLPERRDIYAGSPAHWRTAAAGHAGLGLFLHRVEEVPTGMSGDEYDVRDDAGRVVARGRPARRFRLHYLLWAWSEDGPEEETRLLSDVLSLLAGHQTLPAECRVGSLKDGHPARLTLGREGETGPEGVWGADGLGPRTTLQMALTADLVPGLTGTAPLVDERRVRMTTSAALSGEATGTSAPPSENRG